MMRFAAGSIAGLSLLIAISASGRVMAAESRVLFETGFEAWEGYNPELDLSGQNGWLQAGSGGNGILEGPFDGFFGQVAYVGFAPPVEEDQSLNLFRPVALKPLEGSYPIVRFTVSFMIFDSTTEAPWFDDFRWSVYNTLEERLFTLDFDNEALEINYVLDDGEGFRPTGFQFDPMVPYDLEIVMNFARNLWTAYINGAVVVNSRPMTTRGALLDLNEVDAVWAIRYPGFAGDNFMIFDDYRLVAESAAELPPTLEPVGMLTTGSFIIRVLGEPGIRYRVEGTSDFISWDVIGTGLAQSPGGALDIQDSSGRKGARFYRAYSVP
jgi:hypothetical protein